MKLLEREIDAVIFDLDGTLIDSTSIWGDIDRNFFLKRGREIPEGYEKEIAHIGLEKAAVVTKEKYGIEESIDEIIKEWKDASIDAYTNYIPLKEGAKEFLSLLKKNNVKMAVATANDKSLYEPCLRRLGILDFFDIIMDVKLVSESKSSPLLYNTIAQNLHAEPQRIAIFEDISIGLKTGFENGYFTIGVDDKESRKDEKNKREFSHAYIYSFKELI